VTIAKQLVYEGTGNRELVYVWFKARLMHVLVTHDVADPKALASAALALQ
jgi:ABC-type nitrate/sulfonate/bicarbonate transport system ATPase subunit